MDAAIHVAAHGGRAGYSRVHCVFRRKLGDAAHRVPAPNRQPECRGGRGAGQRGLLPRAEQAPGVGARGHGAGGARAVQHEA